MVSIGVAAFVASDDVSTTFLISAADKTLYEAKRAGRNRDALRDEHSRFTVVQIRRYFNGTTAKKPPNSWCEIS